MASFSQDRKWVEAKRAIGNLNWIEVISYYRSIDGKNVFVYSVAEGGKRLIVDVLDDDTVLLLDKRGEPVTDTYENVFNSKKVFKYNEEHSEQAYQLQGADTYIATESHKESGSDN